MICRKTSLKERSTSVLEHSENASGIITSIQHFSVHDGPGIRTAVFLKGCPLKCRWCANPETQQHTPEPAWSASKCIGCGECVKKLGCSFSQDRLTIPDPFGYSPDRINEVCPGGALHIIGETMTAVQIVDICERDRAFFGEDGGITVTGGEPLIQADFTASIFEEAHRRGINTAIETCGFSSLDNAVKAAEGADSYITDIKCITEELHTENTGVSNRQILGNLTGVSARFPEKPILVRTPVIPGFNDRSEEILLIAEYLNKLGGSVKWELLRYHRLGLPKYEMLGRDYPMGSTELDKDLFDRLHVLAGEAFENTI